MMIIFAVVILALIISGTIIILSSLSHLEDDERCPEIIKWVKFNTTNISSVTRCTFKSDHIGPHHTLRPDTEKDHWWENTGPSHEVKK